MVNLFPNNSIMRISNGTIEEISNDRNTTFVTISYMERANNRNAEQRVRLVVNNSTSIFDEDGNFIPVTDLDIGMTINAAISSAMTRSIPPQATAYMIRIVQRPILDNIAVGTILEIDRDNRSFTTIRDRNPSSIIRFNVTEDAMIFDRAGRRMNFSRLMPGMRVRVRHAAFMTASIPPQTTAFEIRVL